MKDVHIGCSGWVYAPAGFVFAVKGSRYLTHVRRLRGIEEGLVRFWEPLEPLREAGKLGPVLWQLPGNFHHGARGRNGNYSRTELDTWRRRIAAWRSRREVFAYLNNDWEEFAPPNAIQLREGLSAAQPV